MGAGAGDPACLGPELTSEEGEMDVAGSADEGDKRSEVSAESQQVAVGGESHSGSSMDTALIALSTAGAECGEGSERTEGDREPLEVPASAELFPLSIMPETVESQLPQRLLQARALLAGPQTNDSDSEMDLAQILTARKKAQLARQMKKASSTSKGKKSK